MGKLYVVLIPLNSNMYLASPRMEQGKNEPLEYLRLELGLASVGINNGDPGIIKH